jgi:DNA-binding beta-propeller fold protein YncE
LVNLEGWRDRRARKGRSSECSTRVMAAVFAVTVACVLAAPANTLAARGHVRSSLGPFGGPCTGSGGSCEPGQIKEPFGVAVSEATGNVYVVDRGANRVAIFSGQGAPEGELVGPNATGTATLTEGSVEMEVVTATGAFTVGEEVTGEGISPGTVVEDVHALNVFESLSLVVLSQPVEAGKSGTFVPVAGAQAFEAPTAIAVDNSCEQHEPEPLSEPECSEVDPSAGSVYVEDGFSRQAIDKFSAAGEYLGQITEQSIQDPRMEFLSALNSGVSVDLRGRLFVAASHFEETSFGSGRVEGIDSFSDAANNAWEGFSIGPFQNSPAERGLATDATGHSYVRYESNGSHGAVAELGANGELIDEAVGGELPSGVAYGGVAVEPATGDVYIDNVGSVGRFGPSNSGNAPEVERFGAGSLPASVCEDEPSCAGGIAVDSGNGEVYVVDAAGEVLQFVLEEPAVPSVQSESVVDVTDGSARLGAEINPRSLAGEPVTSYRFEYGVCSSPSTCAVSPFELRAPELHDGSLSAGFETETVSELVHGLRADETYHFRVVAENGHGAATGVQESTFTTRGAGEFALVDERQWQLVSPADKHGALIEPIGQAWPIQAASDGGAITYATDSPTEPAPAGYTGLQQVLSARLTAGWSTKDLGIPHISSPGALTVGQEYRFFSEDLLQAAVQPFGSFVACQSADGEEQPCLSPTASEQTAFLRSDYTAAGELCTNSCYTPFVTASEGDANVPHGTVFGVDREGVPCPPSNIRLCGPNFVGATETLAHGLLNSYAPLTSDPVNRGLYEWSAGSPPSEQLRLVSVPPGSETGVPGDLGEAGVRHAISPDGSRVVWTDGSGHLYLRVNATRPQSPISGGECVQPADACTVQVDTGLSGTAMFQLADTKVLHVLFTDEGDLYEFDVAHDALLRVTENADLQGLVTGASEDASWVYFVANSVLGDGAEHGAVTGNCDANGGLASHTCNLYVLHNGAIEFIAALSARDHPDWGAASGAPPLKNLTARVSPDGRWLAFMSQRSLTGYDNRDASSGKPDQEVFLYHASTGTLICASCNPTGARPHGFEYGIKGSQLENVPNVGGFQVWEGTTWLAANVPGWTPVDGSAEAFHQARYLSNGGRLFFNSSDGLVPKDVNGQEDVYEFEPKEDGGCAGPSTSSGGVTYSSATEGCVGLLSSGRSAQESALLDASENGDDVFFLTTVQLLSEDVDTAFDIYDAHVCTSTVPCGPAAASPLPPCATEASCKAAPSPQPELFGRSGSATFSGPGNVMPSPSQSTTKPKTAAQIRAEKLARALKSCKKLKSKKKRTACRKRAARRYGSVKTRKVTGKRRAGR